MSAKIGALIIHGMGEMKKGFSDGMVSALHEELKDKGVKRDDIAFQEIYWQDIVQTQQTLYLNAANSAPMDYMCLRKFVLNYLSDATLYQKIPSSSTGHSLYELIHKEVHNCIVQLEGKVGEGAPLVVLAHSLGGHVMSNYIWDRQCKWVGINPPADDPFGKSDFQRLKTLSSFITFGCNLPLFVMATSPYKPIKVPSPGLKIKDWGTNKKWRNYYDRDDILGWPLLPLANGRVMDKGDIAIFQNMVADFEVDVGWWGIKNWNPWSHTGYWKDKNFIKPVAEHIRDLNKLLP